jgi:hypothetical protein
MKCQHVTCWQCEDEDSQRLREKLRCMAECLREAQERQRLLVDHLQKARDWVQQYVSLPHEPRCERLMEIGDPCSCTAAYALRDLAAIDAVLAKEKP